MRGSCCFFFLVKESISRRVFASRLARITARFRKEMLMSPTVPEAIELQPVFHRKCEKIGQLYVPPKRILGAILLIRRYKVLISSCPGTAK